MRAGVGPRVATPALSGAVGTLTAETRPEALISPRACHRGAAAVHGHSGHPSPSAPGPASLRPALSPSAPPWLPSGRAGQEMGTFQEDWSLLRLEQLLEMLSPHCSWSALGWGRSILSAHGCGLPKPGHSDGHLHSGWVVRDLGSCRGASQGPQVPEILLVC